MSARRAQRLQGAVEPLVFAAAMCGFALCVHRVPALAAIALLAACVPLYHFFRTAAAPSQVMGFRPFPQRWLAAALLGAALGAGFGVICRVRYEMGALPAAVTGFALPAALIGATEETLYRGYVQGRLRVLGAWAAVAGASLAHTAYKACLFLLPRGGEAVDVPVLAFWTFLGGCVFGLLRERTRSVVPPLLAHAVFDIIVYGGRTTAPWWVWH